MTYFERFKDIAILQLQTKGFERLTEKQKKLCYYLGEAGLWGRFITMDQASALNIPLVSSLVSLYSTLTENSVLKKQVRESLFVLFTHGGVYHGTSGEKLDLPLELATLNQHTEQKELIEEIKQIWFLTDIPQFRTVQTDGVDAVAQSGGNFYKGLTTQEVIDYRDNAYPKYFGDKAPPFGFNERLVKTKNGEIVAQTVGLDGLYGNYVLHIIDNLTKALDYTENEKQHRSIKTLIDFYRTGDPVDFDKHCIAWVQDDESDIFFINGLIESYEDPLSVGCTFESIVAFKNPEQTAKVNKIIENIQWFEDNMPFEDRFKKEKAVGLSASSISVVSMAGEASPSLPLGVNLPNSEWIRQDFGSKSVNLENVSSSRSIYETVLRETLYLKKYHKALSKYLQMTESLHTDLHEIAGHGSGKVLEGVCVDSIGAYFSTIEETRADLVGLYFMPNVKLKEVGIFDKDVNIQEAALANYVSYITNGAFAQLRRVSLGNDLTQAHFRNRQLISQWVLKNSDPSKIKLTVEQGLHYVEINDIDYVREKFGELLNIVQKIKSTGDFEGAKDLVMTYGTKVDSALHKETLDRIEKLDMPKVTGFMTPVIKEINGKMELIQETDFFKQQLDLYEKYFIPN